MGAYYLFVAIKLFMLSETLDIVDPYYSHSSRILGVLLILIGF